MVKTRAIFYADPELLVEVDRVALRLAVSRSAIISAAIAAGLEHVETSMTRKRHGQGARPVRLSGTGGAYVPPRRAAPSAKQRTLARVGQTILSVQPSIGYDGLQEALASAIPVHLPGVDPDTLDLDAIVDTLMESHDGDLVPVPGDEPPDDRVE